MEDERVQIEDSRMGPIVKADNHFDLNPAFLPNTHKRFSDKIWYAILD